MRTTLNLSDTALLEAKEYAAARSLSLGEATSILIVRGARVKTPVHMDGNFFVFSPGQDAETISLEHTLKIEDESE
jgi:hypothetical protein